MNILLKKNYIRMLIFIQELILKAIGFPTSMFTVLFAIGRTVGWVSQWKEMIEDPINKIGRPRQLYTGSNTREYQSYGIVEKKNQFLNGFGKKNKKFYYPFSCYFKAGGFNKF